MRRSTTRGRSHRELDTAASRIRIAQLYVGSDQAVDTDLLIAAAKDAIFLSDLPLGERLARAAFERGGGLRAAELLSRALMWQGHPVQAEEILARFDPENLDEWQLVQWGITRVSILFWSRMMSGGPMRSWHCCVSVCSTPA